MYPTLHNNSCVLFPNLNEISQVSLVETIHLFTTQELLISVNYSKLFITLSFVKIWATIAINPLSFSLKPSIAPIPINSFPSKKSFHALTFSVVS